MGRNGGAISKATAKRLNQVPVVRSPSITSSHLNAVAPLVRINRINSDAETLYRVQAASRVTSVVPFPKGTYKSSAGSKVFSDRKDPASVPKKSSPPPQQLQTVQIIHVVRRTSPPIVVQAEHQRQGYINISSNSQPKSRGERLEEQRQRRELRKRETLTSTPQIRAKPTSIFDSLSSKRR